ncbi:hypothetical protein Pla52o_57020 [Novipirellula galeiformis]|uniref:DUF1569 domain-containing protein n=1 Tax=Novipirellula galeiformis TaxID=2528004 RepID=A0A5C6BE61_9BACT|nr:DUF1569 domain-containing protein [Novipirellula galeiformis]TWU10328.1 hypothetical protein Pla52o_57020 [Novipirellula galeiformis]
MENQTTAPADADRHPTRLNPTAGKTRRELKFNELTDAVSECERLLGSGYVRNGNWSLGQICRHMKLTIEANMHGYPTWMSILGYPLRPLLRWLVLPRLLSGHSPSGVKTAPMFVPPMDLDDATEVSAFTACVLKFQSNTGPLHPHPGFGPMDRDGFNQFHAAHAAHHLRFLEPAVEDSSKSVGQQCDQSISRSRVTLK